MWSSAPELASSNTLFQHVLQFLFLHFQLHKTTMFHIMLCRICSRGSVVRVLRFISERLPVLIQAVCFCPSGLCAPTLFKPSETKPILTSPSANPLTIMALLYAIMTCVIRGNRVSFIHLMTLLWHYCDTIVTLLWHYDIHYEKGNYYDTIMTLLRHPLWHPLWQGKLLWHYYDTIMTLLWHYYYYVITLLSHHYDTL